ncbi:MAG: hypothetical protein UDB11_00140, partial [Peptococcaceae bacterium]|nr:hypothetical protein [Peptococcaceae bacterium]
SFFRDALASGAGVSRQRICILLSLSTFVNPFSHFFAKKFAAHGGDWFQAFSKAMLCNELLSNLTIILSECTFSMSCW